MPGFQRWLTVGRKRVPQVSSDLNFVDRLGAWKARWGIGRMSFMVPPGLYAVGIPTPEDPVVVTANYKMSYDIVRRELAGRNVWLLVLETYGINVWCAAGKGTFGTGELVRRIASSGLADVVSHRRLLLPILGAAGVSAHDVAKRTGFRVQFAAIRACDLAAFLDNGMVTTPAMQALTFSSYERLVLVPVELVLALKSVAVIGGVALLLASVLAGIPAGIEVFFAYFGAVLTGLVIGPLLLPWLPGRSFAVKGAIAGMGWCALYYLLAGRDWSAAAMLAAFLALPVVSAFHTLNFTGCSPFTSRSGVKKEMHLALPAMGGALVLSAILLLAGRFI